MRKTYDVLVYPAGCTDFANEGLCGPLACESCIEQLEGGGEYSLDLEIMYDAAGKWKNVLPGGTIKAWTQKRLGPTWCVSDNGSGGYRVGFGNMAGYYQPSGSAGGAYLYAGPSSSSARMEWIPAGMDIWAFKDGSLLPSANGFYHVHTPLGPGWMQASGLIGDGESHTGTQARAALGEVAIRPQLYWIESVERTLEGLTVHCVHNWYRMGKNLIMQSYNGGIYGVTLQQMLDWMRTSCVETSAFRGYAIAPARDAGDPPDWQYENPVTAVLDGEKGALKLWELGYLYRENFEFYLTDDTFSEWKPPVDIEIGKNMVGISALEDWSGLITHVVPTWENGYNKMIYTLTDGPLVRTDADDYDQARVMGLRVDVSDLDWSEEMVDISQGKAEARAWEKGHAALYAAENGPALSISVDVEQVDLAAKWGTDVSAERRVIELLEPLAIYGVATVHGPRTGADYYEMIIRRGWDCLHGRMTDCEMGMARSASKDWSAVLPADYLIRSDYTPDDPESGDQPVEDQPGGSL